MLRYDYRGKLVLVTGGAQGIGFGIANAFADAGADVHVTGTRASAQDYPEALDRFRYHTVQLAQQADREALAAAVGDIDVLVNNAGRAGDNEYDSDEFARTIEVNLNAAADICYRFHERLARRGGAIVNIGSVASFLALRRTPAYTASKAGLLGLTRALADQWAREGLRVNLVAPGFIETRMIDAVRQDEAARRATLGAIPLRRFGLVTDVAAAVLFLASPAASYITGQSLVVDGGLMLR